jgi:hypothetical protein
MRQLTPGTNGRGGRDNKQEKGGIMKYVFGKILENRKFRGDIYAGRNKAIGSGHKQTKKLRLFTKKQSTFSIRMTSSF